MNRDDETSDKGHVMSDLTAEAIKRGRDGAARADTFAETVCSADGTAIAFSRLGQGPPLILVDGALCHRAMGPSSPLAALLAQDFRVFTYDRRGRGDSEDTRPYAVEREIEDLQALIEAAGGSVYVWAISSGAALALEATRRGADVSKLALYEPPFIVDDSRPPIPPEIVPQLNALVAAGRRSDAVRLFLRRMGAPSIAIALMRLLPVWKKLTRLAHTLPYDMTIVNPYQAGTPLPADRWDNVTIPALVMVGGKSPTWFHHTTQALANLLPSAAHRIVEGQTHNVKTQSLAAPLKEFFNS
jgi:pimeloyl-ACP methyl ester carboxylesterase